MKDLTGPVLAAVIAIGTVLIGAHELAFSRSEGEALSHQVERLDDRVGKGFEELRQDMRTFFRKSAKANIKPKAPPEEYAISEDRYRDLKRRARAEAGHELFSFGEPLDSK